MTHTSTVAIVRTGLIEMFAYAWAAPNTLLGMLAGLAVLSLGGRLRLVRGVAEFHGGWAARFFAAFPGPLRFCAMTLGHVILGTSQADLAVVREHEHVHVRQYERWGAFFLPAYVLSSVWEILHGRSGYRDNCFEKQASSVQGRGSRS